MQRKMDALKKAGFIVGPRDKRLNRAFAGVFMVAEPYQKDQTPTDDASKGPWCIVGNNLAALITQAYEQWEHEISPEGN